MSCCKKRESFRQRYSSLLSRTPLNDFERTVIEDRYIGLVENTAKDYRRTSSLFIILTNMISVSSVVVAVLVAIDKSMVSTCTSTALSDALFWIVLSLSIMLALSNKWLYSFNLHKKYIINKDTLEKFHSEGWTFIVGNGKYKSCKDFNARYKLFCSRIEQIKNKSVKGVNALEAQTVEMLATAAPTDGETPRKRVRRSKQITQRCDANGSDVNGSDASDRVSYHVSDNVQDEDLTDTPTQSTTTVQDASDNTKHETVNPDNTKHEHMGEKSNERSSKAHHSRLQSQAMSSAQDSIKKSEITIDIESLKNDV